MQNHPVNEAKTSRPNLERTGKTANLNGSETSRTDTLTAALAYAIRNAVANGAGWSPDIVEWAESCKTGVFGCPKTVSGGDLVRLAVGLPTRHRTAKN